MRLKQGCSGIWIAALAAALDRITKVAVRHILLGTSAALTDSGRLFRVPGVFSIRYVPNTGVAFSLLDGGGAAVTILTALLAAAVAAWLIARPDGQPRRARAGLWMIVGGGLGNLYDRVAYGHVIDFIDLEFVRFAVFNVADIFIVCGAILALAAMLMDERRKEKAHG